MSLESEIEKILSLKSADYVKGVRINEIARVIFVEIPLGKIKGKVERGYTSRLQISKLCRLIQEKTGLRPIPVFLASPELAQLESGLQASLLLAHPDIVSDCSISFSAGNAANVTVILSDLLDERKLEAIRRHVREMILLASLTVDRIDFISPTQPPASLASILRAVKILSPVAPKTVYEYLKSRDFTCPSEKWLATKLDSARRKGLLVRSDDGAYALSADGVSVVPALRSKNSSDIERILLLAKRREW
ncbi:hypothetical protein [Aquipseudomonas alcaligenes]|uniref:Uncharacterized protein n=1 Tax=Aquipseudomonas alcaligenes TaxID=43263 RepID=A0AB73I3N0_AQUAC|nr:hypothetical protein [Pseudomonas alcaligenes]MDH0144694.1 hypothetical protein [Pseudomonas alcaligenes]